MSQKPSGKTYIARLDIFILSQPQQRPFPRLKDPRVSEEHVVGKEDAQSHNR